MNVVALSAATVTVPGARATSVPLPRRPSPVMRAIVVSVTVQTTPVIVSATVADVQKGSEKATFQSVTESPTTRCPQDPSACDVESSLSYEKPTMAKLFGPVKGGGGGGGGLHGESVRQKAGPILAVLDPHAVRSAAASDKTCGRMAQRCRGAGVGAIRDLT